MRKMRGPSLYVAPSDNTDREGRRVTQWAVWRTKDSGFPFYIRLAPERVSRYFVSVERAETALADLRARETVRRVVSWTAVLWAFWVIAALAYLAFR